MNSLCTLVRDFQVKALQVESYPRDSKRVFGGQRCVKRRLLRTVALGDEGVSSDVLIILFFVSCTGHTSFAAPEEEQNFCPPFKHQFPRADQSTIDIRVTGTGSQNPPYMAAKEV